MSDPAAIDDLFKKTVAEWGTVDVLVNNAGATEGERKKERERCRGGEGVDWSGSADGCVCVCVCMCARDVSRYHTRWADAAHEARGVERGDQHQPQRRLLHLSGLCLNMTLACARLYTVG